MVIKTVETVINGSKYNLTYNSGTGKWEATIPAPVGSSFNQEDGKYNVLITATNEAGTSASIDRTDETYGSVLALKVIEKQAPVITIISPGVGAHIASATPTIKFSIKDNTIGDGGDSGIDISSLVLKVDDTAVSAESIIKNAVDGGFDCEYTPNVLTDGSHTVTIDVNDNDGNAATTSGVSFTVDTVPPVLNVDTPNDNIITNIEKITVSGTTNDATSTIARVSISLNGNDQGEVYVDANGNFTKEITLAEGANEIIVTSTDNAGKSSTVNRTVTLDISIPIFVAVTLTPNPADAGATLTLTVEVE